MRLRLAFALIAATTLYADAAIAQLGSYEQAAADWRALQGWFQRQIGDYRAGADYWAGNRSKAGHEPCEKAAITFSGDRSEFVAGCEESKRRLDPIDAKRLSDPMYRAGFNYAAEELPISPPSGPKAGDVVPAPAANGSARDLADVLGPDPSDRFCQDMMGPNASPVGSPRWVQCKADSNGMDVRAQCVWDRWTPDQRVAFLSYHHTADGDDRPPDNWDPTGAASWADIGVTTKYAEIAACGAPTPNADCPARDDADTAWLRCRAN